MSLGIPQNPPAFVFAEPGLYCVRLPLLHPIELRPNLGPPPYGPSFDVVEYHELIRGLYTMSDELARKLASATDR